MGSSRGSAGVSGVLAASAPPPGIESSFSEAAMARPGSPTRAATRARRSAIFDKRVGISFWMPSAKRSLCLRSYFEREHGDARRTSARMKSRRCRVHSDDIDSQARHGVRPARRNNSWKRGSERSGSNIGSTLRKTIPADRSAKDFFNHSNASSLSFRPT